MRAIKTFALLAALTLIAGLTAVPAAAQGDDPYIVAWIGGGTTIGAPEQFVSGQDYEIGDMIDLYINGVYRGTAEAEPNAEGTASPFFDVGFEAGDEIKLIRQRDQLERVLIAHDLSVAWASSTLDIVAGSAEPGSEVLVLIGFTGDYARYETADRIGRFFADFSRPGDGPDEQNLFDLMPGDLAAALQFDVDGDVTAFFVAASDDSVEPAVKADCKRGGWELLVRADGTPFMNQGECIRYVKSGM